MDKVTILKRKPNQILACQYGHIWPLDMHTSGYVKIIDPESQSYIWASNKQTLESVNVKGKI